MKRVIFNDGWLFCHDSGTALERTANGTQTMVPEKLMQSDGELKIEVE